MSLSIMNSMAHLYLLYLTHYVRNISLKHGSAVFNTRSNDFIHRYIEREVQL